MELRSKRLAAGGTALVVGLGVLVTTGGVSLAASQDERAKNVIYMVGDGMGVTHRNAARLRFEGAEGELEMDKLPVVGMVSTYSVQEDSDQPDLVPDSAATGTSWSSGVKTYNGAVGKDAFGNDVGTLMEEAKAAGLRTGNVSTAEVTDATPAAMMSHVSRRACQGPSTQMGSTACEGETPIAQQVSRNETADLIFGGGLRRFEPADQEAFEGNGYQVLGSFGDPALPAGGQTADSQRTATGAELAAVDDHRVVALFNRGNLTVEQFKTENPDSTEAVEEPTLSELTTKAIELLDAGDTPGFLLQVESALVDKRSHANDAGQTLEEMREFDDAVAAAVAFAEADGETLVVVTADHECAGFTIIGQGSFTNAEATSPPGNIDSSNHSNSSDLSRERGAKDPVRSPNIYNAPGATTPNNFAPATFRTADDPEGVEDGTEEASLWLSYLSGNHTGADIPVTAMGPGSAAFDGFQDNTDHYVFMRSALGLDRGQSPPPAEQPTEPPAEQPGDPDARPVPVARGVEQSCPPGRVPATRFSDVPADDTHDLTIRCVAWYEIAEGFRDGTFEPRENVSRAQMGAFIARTITRGGGSLPSSPPNAFADDDRSVHAPSIDQLAAVGVVFGRADGSYGPDETVTRGQMTTFLVRAHRQVTGADLPAGGDYFDDTATSEHRDSISTAARAGFTEGRDGRTFAPQDGTQRGQMATFLARLLDLLVEQGETDPPQ